MMDPGGLQPAALGFVHAARTLASPMMDPGGLQPAAPGFAPGRCSQPTPRSAKPPRTTEARKGHLFASPNLKRRHYRARRPCGQSITVPPYRPRKSASLRSLKYEIIGKTKAKARNRRLGILHLPAGARHAPPVRWRPKLLLGWISQCREGGAHLISGRPGNLPAVKYIGGGIGSNLLNLLSVTAVTTKRSQVLQGRTRCQAAR